MGNIIHVFEFIAALLATYHYKKYNKSTEKYFMHFLWFVFIIDFGIGGYIGKVLKTENSWVYNIYFLISFLFYFNWYYKIIQKKKFKQIVFFLAILFVFIDVYSFIFEDNKEYHIKAFVFGAIINLIATLLYFSELLSSKIMIHIKYKLSFWIATALLLFNVGIIPFMIYTEEITMSNQNLYQIILISFNLILYTCYSIGFIWSKKEYNQE
ncbi:hypothetical protein H9W90_14880 [Polaribacter pectinis]|uniref:YhhN-like protein n=1 Tax=Polaribacter pectinis TaxID=2738844 RepID=A0A7G9LA03_9FLAO|nr:hypothetical protein [Polaribacter pectinis]QNM85452.1 hypothetical protein H9W90_14880 [Polaribacter pectinis]